MGSGLRAWAAVGREAGPATPGHHCLRDTCHQRAGPWPALQEPLQHIPAPHILAPQEAQVGTWYQCPAYERRKGRGPDLGVRGVVLASSIFWGQRPTAPLLLMGIWGKRSLERLVLLLKVSTSQAVVPARVGSKGELGRVRAVLLLHQPEASEGV